MFTSVTYDENNVYFTLSDGSVLIVPRANSGGVGENDPSDIIKFEDLNVKSALLQMDIDINADGEISYGEAANVDTLNFEENKDIMFFKEFKYFTNIKHFTFSQCSNLCYIDLPNTIKNIPNKCFYYCTKLISLQIPESCTKIGEYAFYLCSSLKRIVLPSKLKRIERNTFTNCALTSLDIPNSVNYIAFQKEAIQGLYIDTLTLPEEYSADQIGPLSCYKLTTIVWNSISYPTDYVYHNGTYYFYGLGAYYSSKLANETILTVVFGEKVESLPKYLCYKMNTLKTIYCKNLTPPIIDKETFVNCNNIENVYVPTVSVDAYKMEWSQFADKIVGYNF
jgi:hypothetical protein